MKYTIDATDKKLGRIATEVAGLLMGKQIPGYTRHTEHDATVEVQNAGHIAMSNRKRRDTNYVTYSGYPGGLKTKRMEQVIDKKGMSELVRIAVKGMLPKNKLQARMMKKLTVTE